MKRPQTPVFLVLLCFATGLLAVHEGFAAPESFSARLTSEQYAAAGLGRLTPEELSVLNQLIASDAEGEKQIAVEEAKAVATAEATAAAEQSQEKRGWVRLLPGMRIEHAEIESAIEGTFRGWRGGTIFSLQNGQVWKQVDGETYVTRSSQSPAVRIKSGALGSFFMTVEGVNPRVKVERVN